MILFALADGIPPGGFRPLCRGWMLFGGHPNPEEAVTKHPDAPSSQQPCELGQRDGGLGAEDVQEHCHEVDVCLMAIHPAEVGVDPSVLEVGELLYGEQVNPRDDEQEPDAERGPRQDFKRNDRLGTCKPVDVLGGGRRSVGAFEEPVDDQEYDGED